MLLRILPVLVFVSAMTFAQVTTNPVATAPGSDKPPIEPGVSLELAKWRAARYSDVRYKLNLTLEKMSPVLKGTIEIRVKVTPQAEPPASAGGGTAIVLDWRKIKDFEDRSTISNVSVNGKAVTVASTPPADAGGSAFEHNEHLVFRGGVIAGENVIKLDFTSPILTSGSAITRYVDKVDGAEYIYSLFVPSDASTAFPVFDQPDLKARFELAVEFPDDWTVVSNSETESTGQTFRGAGAEIVSRRANIEFAETKPISTYVFAFAAGPFERVAEPPALAGGTVPGANQPAVKSETPPPADAGGTDSDERVSVPPGLAAGEMPDANQPSGKSETSPPAHAGGSAIYVRKSQAEKFKPHAAEVFRLNREAIKYFEEYFDYKFPFPKYDLVLIPEFPFGGMEHAGATFLRESAVIFPQEPTKNDHISRALLIFHEAAHQWFGDTVTMRWFDDLWLKEGFANFAAYKAMEKIMPETNAWKVFYERVKQAAYRTDSTKGTTPIYQEIKNLSAAKSAYGNIVYNKAPAFLRQAEFYLGEDKFQTAVRAFLKKHEFGNAGWESLVKEFEVQGGEYARFLASNWVNQRGMPKFTYGHRSAGTYAGPSNSSFLEQSNALGESASWYTEFNVLTLTKNDSSGEYERKVITVGTVPHRARRGLVFWNDSDRKKGVRDPDVVFPNYQDYGYGIFLLDDKSRDYVLKNIQKEKDPFLRSMMWGALWDSVREGELDPREYVELVVRVLGKSDGFSRSDSGTPKGVTLTETLTEDESTIATLLGRTSTALNYYLPAEPPALAGGKMPAVDSTSGKSESLPPAYAGGSALRSSLENMLIERMENADTLGQRITYYRAFLNVAGSENARRVLKKMLADADKSLPLALASGKVQPNGNVGKTSPPANAGGTDLFGKLPLRTKDKFDIVTKLLILGDTDGPKLLAELEKKETSDEAKRYAYAAKAGIATAENKAKYWNDFVNNKEISESWIEAAFGPFNSIRHNELTLPYLQKALQELPNHKRSRKIFFVNGWLGAFIGGQRSEEAFGIVNKFLADNPNLDNDLRLKILENVDVIERAVKIRAKFGN